MDSHQKESTKDKIVKTVMSILAEKNMSEVTVRDICKAADISTGSFYYHFPSKEAAILGCEESYESWLQRQYEKQTFESNKDALFYIFHMYFKNSQYCSHNGIASFSALRLLAENDSEFQQQRFSSRTLLYHIRTGLESGEFRSAYTPEELTSEFYRNLRGINYDWALKGGSYDIMKVGELLMKRVFHMYIICY